MNKLTIFDTHCHLADEKYLQQSKDTKEIIQTAEKAGVKYILNVGYDKKTNYKVVEQLAEFPNLFGALGLHPNSSEDLIEENLDWIEKQLINKRIIAIGEIGLDYYERWKKVDTEERKKQKKWFKKQLELAKKYNLPVLLHIRDNNLSEEAFNETYKIVKEVEIKKGILHCFTGTWEIAAKFIDLGFYISLAGNITRFKWQDKWKKVIEKIPLNKIVVETDSPYLIPEPLVEKEKFNYPQNIIYTLKKIAEIKKIGEKEVGEKIYFNTLRLFNFL